MKILAEETVVRYHIEFDEKETARLRSVGFLPPNGEPRAQLWSTKSEIDTWTKILGETREPTS